MSSQEVVTLITNSLGRAASEFKCKMLDDQPKRQQQSTRTHCQLKPTREKEQRPQPVIQRAISNRLSRLGALRGCRQLNSTPVITCCHPFILIVSFCVCVMLDY